MRAAVSPLVPKPRKAGAAIWSAGRIHTRLRAPPVSLCFPFFLLLAQTVHVVEAAGFVLFLLADAAVIRLVEPDIHRYGDALWYCYAVISTAGFGDIVTVTLIGKICSVLLTIYTIFVVAIVTGVVVNFYTQLVEMQQKETLAMFMDKLERLPELSKEELEHISQKVRKFR